MVVTRSQNEANPKVKRIRKVSKAINPMKQADTSMRKKNEATPLGTAILTFNPGPDMLALVFSLYGYAD